MHRVAFRLSIFILMTGAFRLTAAPSSPPRQDVPWDSLVAQIQIIESINQSDSVKTALLNEAFAARHLTVEEYRAFYEGLLQKNPIEQRRFFERVKAILEGLLNPTPSPQKDDK